MTSRLSLYWHTLRRLSPSQIGWKAVRHAQGWWDRRRGNRVLDTLRWAIDDTRAASIAAVLSAAYADRMEERIEAARSVCNGEFTFLNETRVLRSIDWNCRYNSHLWNFNLHYFAYAPDLAFAYRATGDEVYRTTLLELMGGWIDTAKPGLSDGWHPYPVSLRLINWTYAVALLIDAGEELPSAIVDSLGSQAEYLSRRLEYHVRGNHLLENGRALAVSAGLLAGPTAASLAFGGQRLFWSQLGEQTLDDGTHCELSPMYQLIVLQGALELAAIQTASGTRLGEDQADLLRRMVRSTSCLTRSDGQPRHLNDGASGIAQPLGCLEPLITGLLDTPVPEQSGTFVLPDAGYFGVVDTDYGDSLIVDCGPPAVGRQLGHAHCDVASFEWDVGGEALVVDSGTCGYAGCRLRSYCRSTAAHNTLTIDDLDQSEMWSVFRVARIASVRSASLVSNQPFVFSGSYSPFHDLSVEHFRRFERANRDLRIIDRIEGATGRTVRGFLHLHPLTDVRRHESGLELCRGRARVVFRQFGYDTISVKRGAEDPMQGWHCPEFGQAVAAPTLVMTRQDYPGENLVMEFTVRDA